MILLLGSTSLGFGSVFFCVIAKSQLLPSSHMPIFTRSFAQAVRSQVLFWLGQVNTFTDIVSYWSTHSQSRLLVSNVASIYYEHTRVCQHTSVFRVSYIIIYEHTRVCQPTSVFRVSFQRVFYGQRSFLEFSCILLTGKIIKNCYPD